MIQIILRAIGSLLNLAGEPIRRPRWMRSELSGPEQDAEALRQDWEMVLHGGTWTPGDPEQVAGRLKRRPREEV